MFTKQEAIKKGGGICIYIHKQLEFKLRNDTDIFNSEIKICFVEIINSKSRNVVVTGVYRPPKGDIKVFKNYCKDFLKKKSGSSKTVFMVGDLNINSFDYDNNALVKNFFNLIFQSGFLPLIQRATRVTRTTATAIDHIITDAILESTMHSGIIKANISDHFPIFAILENSCNKNKNYEKTKITKRDFSNENIQNFQFLLENIKWDQLLPSNAPNEAYNIFLKIFSDLYDVAFPKKEIEIKSKYLNTPWITKGIRKSSKRKQRLYEKYLKIKSKENERELKKMRRKIIIEIKSNYLKMIYKIHGK